MALIYSRNNSVRLVIKGVATSTNFPFTTSPKASNSFSVPLPTKISSASKPSGAVPVLKARQAILGLNCTSPLTLAVAERSAHFRGISKASLVGFSPTSLNFCIAHSTDFSLGSVPVTRPPIWSQSSCRSSSIGVSPSNLRASFSASV